MLAIFLSSTICLLIAMLSSELVVYGKQSLVARAAGDLGEFAIRALAGLALLAMLLVTGFVGWHLFFLIF